MIKLVSFWFLILESDWLTIRDSWLDCSGDSQENLQRRVRGLCPIEWSSFSGRLNCISIWVGVNQTHDLANDYFDRHVSTLEIQLAKSGYRMVRFEFFILKRLLF